MDRTFHIQDIAAIAAALMEGYPEARCFAFYADMGAGKTTLINAIGRYLGIDEFMTSPTFSIVNEYPLPSSVSKVYHMDWYRLKDTEDAIQAGVQDILDTPNVYCFIEWPSIAEELLPTTALRIHIDFVDEETRRLRVE